LNRWVLDAAALGGIGAIAEQCLHDQCDGPERRIFPAAAWIREEETGRTMWSIDSAEHDRHQCKRHPARPDAEDQRDAAQHLNRYDRVGEKACKAEALKVCGRPRRRKDEDLEPAMKDEQDAHRDAQNECREIGIGDIADEGGLWPRIGGDVRHLSVPFDCAACRPALKLEGNIASWRCDYNPGSRKMIASDTEAIILAAPALRTSKMRGQEVDQNPHIGGQMAAMRVEREDAVGSPL